MTFKKYEDLYLMGLMIFSGSLLAGLMWNNTHGLKVGIKAGIIGCILSFIMMVFLAPWLITLSYNKQEYYANIQKIKKNSK